MSLVSVIMPTHNAAEWVCDAIDSVVAQTYPHIELIIIDDGSTDDTVEVLRRKLAADFKHGWRIIEPGGNRGPSAARNIGLAAATGSWVQYLDSDDFLAPSKFELQMAYCAQAPGDVSVIYSPWRRCYFEAGHIIPEGPFVKPTMAGRPPTMCLVGNDRALLSAGLARRSALEAIGGFDETLRFWECEAVNVRLAEIGRMENVPATEPLYHWRLHRGKIYIGRDEARYRSTDVCLGWMRQVLKAAKGRPLDQLGLSQADRTRLLDDCTIWARLLYAQDRAAFREYLAMARALDPAIAPAHPRYAAALSPILGYEAAEAAAKLGRAPKTLARKLRQAFRLQAPNMLFDWE